MTKNIHGIQNEPHLSRPATSNPELAMGLPHQVVGSIDADESVGHSVWDEPALNTTMAGPIPKDALMFRNWMRIRSKQWTWSQSWFLTVSLTLAAGPVSVVAFLLMIPNLGGLTPIVTCFFSPLLQELTKIALPLWVVERRPYYFKSGFQIALSTIAGGLVFGTVSGSIAFFMWNSSSGGLPYVILFSYIFVHLLCSLLATFGLINIWKRPTEFMQPSKLADGASSFMTAFIVHAIFASLLYGISLFDSVIG